MIICAYASSVKAYYKDWENAEFIHKISINAADSEIVSWVNNGKTIYDLLQNSSIFENAYIAFEIQCPRSGQRIDCMIFGKDNSGKSNILQIEMKQWSNQTVEKVPNIGMFQENLVRAQVGQNAFVYHAHPSEQAFGYQEELMSSMPVFEKDINLYCCSFCYNYDTTLGNNILTSEQFRKLLQKSPLYDKNTSGELSKKISKLFGGGCGQDVFKSFVNSEVRPTRMLMDAVSKMFDKNNEGGFVLQNEQRPTAKFIYDTIIESKNNPKQKYVLIVKGGPGTGKTMIALNVLSDLARNDPSLRLCFATRSSALRDTLKKRLKKIQSSLGISASELICPSVFKIYPRGNKTSGFTENELDVLMIDEAHRTEHSANNMGSGTNTYLSQVISLIYSAKVSIFFIDDRQAVSSKEIGLSSNIREAAEQYYCGRFETDREEFIQKNWKSPKIGLINSIYNDEIIPAPFNNIIVKELPLTSQFRCYGSGNYLDWLDSVLYPNDSDIRKVSNFGNSYEFDVFDTPMELENKIRSLDKPYFSKNTAVPSWVKQTANSKEDEIVARLVAGYCWDWSDSLQKADKDGQDLVHDVTLSSLECRSFKEWTWDMSWETKKIQGKGKYSDYYAPSAELWASHPCGINQLGCVPSAQGFEFDYVGVILGPDIVFENGEIKTIYGKTHSVSGPNADRYIRNIYRVLMSRGKKGCYIFCYDKALSEYFKSLIKNVKN